MSPAETQEFESSVSDEGLSFGFDLIQNEQGELVVGRVTPAGPAWNSNEINQGDVLLELRTPDGKSIDFELADLDDASEILNAAEIKEAELRIRKSDGQVKKVSLSKQRVEQAENVIQSFVLDGERKVGYFSLPGFYTQWENTEALGCANDMAAELLKLRKEKIDGLIIDLRFNGGGSLDEALELAGIFIDAGPLSVLKEKSKPPLTLKDENRGTIYDGPLIIMVNGFSASASELIAATLQDYNRAIVVGAPTYGKATGQIILPLANPSQLEKADGKNGFVKMTIERIYRITGKSYQQRGVRPDILLPDFTNSIPEKERYLAHSLPPDSISKKTYYTPGVALPIQHLRLSSEKRVKESALFAPINKVVQKIMEPVALSLVDFERQKKELSGLLTLVDEARPQQKFTVRPALFDSTLLTLDTDRSSRSKKVGEEIAQSVYINEAYRILCDYLTTLEK
jgi:carboxyl-terminal processing protease